MVVWQQGSVLAKHATRSPTYLNGRVAVRIGILLDNVWIHLKRESIYCTRVVASWRVPVGYVMGYETSLWSGSPLLSPKNPTLDILMRTE